MKTRKHHLRHMHKHPAAMHSQHFFFRKHFVFHISHVIHVIKSVRCNGAAMQNG